MTARPLYSSPINKTKTHKKYSSKELFLDILTYTILGVFIIICLMPIYFMVLLALTPDADLAGTPSLLPIHIDFSSFKYFFRPEYLFGQVKDGVWQNGYLLNTLIVCTSNILGVAFGASLTAYGLTKTKIKGKKIIFGVILGTVLLPGTVTSIPLYIIYNKIGWNGTLLPLCLPIWLGGGAMNIFLIRQFIRGIPNSLTEAAILDGANSFQIYWKIILPLLKPILIYLAVMTFNSCWNDFQGPLLYLGTNREYYTLSLALYKDIDDKAKGVLANAQMAVGIMMMIPGIFLFAKFQKQLREGVSTIGLKG